MKKLFITGVLILITIYPPGASEAKTQRTVKESVASYERIKYEIMVNGFFRKAHEVSKSLNRIENKLK